MRFWSKSTPFLILISLTLRRYCNKTLEDTEAHTRHRKCLLQDSPMKWVASDLTHLKLKETALLLHLLCYLCSTDLSPDHSVLSGVLFFLLLDFRTAWNTQTTLKEFQTHNRKHTYRKHSCSRAFFSYAPAAYCTPRYRCSISSVGKEGPALRHRIPERASCVWFRP